MSSKDERTLYQKLEAMANDPAAAPLERLGARAKMTKILLERKRDAAFMSKHGFDAKPSFDPRQPNAGWTYRNRHESDAGDLRKRDFKATPRYQRGIDRGAWMNLQSEARARASYDQTYFDTMFGIDNPAAASANRERLQEARDKVRTVINGTTLINNICVINGNIIKRILFWDIASDRNTFWFFVERDTSTGETKKSKRYFSRDGALLAHMKDHITWIRTERT